jgi:hypothetical protein
MQSTAVEKEKKEEASSEKVGGTMQRRKYEVGNSP